MPSKLGAEFDETVKWVRQTTGLTFHLRTVAGLYLEGDKCWATATDTTHRGWTIFVERRAPLNVAIDGFLHEVAHILQFQKEAYIQDADDQHTPLWGVEYARLVKAYHKLKGETEV